MTFRRIKKALQVVGFKAHLIEKYLNEARVRNLTDYNDVEAAKTICLEWRRDSDLEVRKLDLVATRRLYRRVRAWQVCSYAAGEFRVFASERSRRNDQHQTAQRRVDEHESLACKHREDS